MSINIGDYLAGGASLVQAQKPLRAQIQWARIQDKPTTIQFRRGATELAEQTVRIEISTNSAMSEGASGVAARGDGFIFGIKDHPTLPDLDVDEWDTFILDEKEYTITFVNRHLIGQIQAEFGVTG